MLLLVDERLQLVDSLAAALERVQLVGVDVVLVEDLLPLRQDGERLAAVGADPRGAAWLLFSDVSFTEVTRISR